MAVKWFLLFFFAICTAESNGKTSRPREPSCGKMDPIGACPMNLLPVCGTDGITYANECALCVQEIQRTRLRRERRELLKDVAEASPKIREGEEDVEQKGCNF